VLWQHIYPWCVCVLHSVSVLPMKMELIEGSETSAISIVTPGNYPKENTLHTGHGESLKSRILHILLLEIPVHY